MKKEQEKNNNTQDIFYVQSIDRALTLIDVISEQDNRGLTLVELSSITKLPTSTTYRLLNNLLRWDYVSLSDDGKYYLGLVFLKLGCQVSESLNLVNFCAPYLTDLNEKSGETIYLTIYDKVQNNGLYIDKRPGKGNIRLVSTVGAHNGVYCSASGKALLFSRTESEIRDILSKIEIVKKTNNTITDIDEITNEIIESKKRGYALDIEESEYNVACIAAPIIGRDGLVVAAVSISGLVSNIVSPRRFDELKNMLIETSEQISQQLGMPPAKLQNN